MSLSRLRRRRSDEGAALVEFALALPLFALLLFALVDSGLAFGGFITFRNGVDAGARLAASSATLTPLLISSRHGLLSTSGRSSQRRRLRGMSAMKQVCSSSSNRCKKEVFFP